MVHFIGVRKKRQNIEEIHSVVFKLTEDLFVSVIS